ncbi:hypothetical protein ABOONEI_2611 [Aciduliprofundum boonei T469]|nr:hypothetical protein ABOONEI_2611 [Aciduliprofundum boonei T469]
MAKKKDYLGAFIYYYDIIFAIFFAFYFFTGLYGYHLLSHENFKRYILSSGHYFAKFMFFVSFVPLVLYLYFIPYALWRKSKRVWFSRLCCNKGAYVLMALASFYLIVYWTRNFGYFMNHSFATFIYFFGFLCFTTAFAIEGALEIYITHPLVYQIWAEEEYEREMRKLAKQQKKAQQQKNVQQQKQKQSVQMEVKERLKGLKELLDDGLISEEDYKRKKEEILKEL